MAINRLIEHALAGKSAQHIVDALIEELPPLPMLYQTIRKELPKGTGVRIEEYDDSISVGDGTPVFVKPASKSTAMKVRERVDYLRLMFPELEFIVEQVTEADPDAQIAKLAAKYRGSLFQAGSWGDWEYEFKTGTDARSFLNDVNRTGAFVASTKSPTVIIARRKPAGWDEAQTYFGAGLRANDKPPTKVGDRVKVLDGPNKGRLGDVTRFEPDGWYAWVDVEGAGGKLVKYHTKDLRKQ